jgi:hypothetical protein
MKLKLAENTANYPILRLASDGGKWEMGIAPAKRGVIVGCTHHLNKDTHFYNLFFCKSSGLHLMEATAAVAAILSTVPEDANNDEAVSNLFFCPEDNEIDRITAFRIAVSELRSPIVPIDDPDDEFLARLKEICKDVELARQKGFATEIFLSLEASRNMPLPDLPK